jgi:hypothetical protein
MRDEGTSGTARSPRTTFRHLWNLPFVSIGSESPSLHRCSFFSPMVTIEKATESDVRKQCFHLVVSTCVSSVIYLGTIEKAKTYFHISSRCVSLGSSAG